MKLLLHSISRRTFMKNLAALPIYNLVLTGSNKSTEAYSAQPTAADGYGLGTYNQGHYPAQQHNIYLPLITKGA